MQLPDDYKTRQTMVVRNLYVSVASTAGQPFSPFGVSFAMEMEDGTRVAAIMTSRESVIRLVETVLEKAKEAWPDMEEEGDAVR